MKKSNWIILAVLAMACGFFLWLWNYLDFNLIDNPRDLVLGIVWWAAVAVLVLAIRAAERKREERIRTAFVASDAVFTSEGGLVKLEAQASPIMVLQRTLEALRYDFSLADLPEKDQAAFTHIVRTKTFADGGDTWEGEVVYVARPTDAPIPFADRDELLHIVERVPLTPSAAPTPPTGTAAIAS